MWPWYPFICDLNNIQYLIFNLPYLSASGAGHTRTKLPHAALSKHVTKLWVGVMLGQGVGREIIMTLSWWCTHKCLKLNRNKNHDFVLCEAGFISQQLLHNFSGYLPTLWSIQDYSNTIANLKPSSPYCHPPIHSITSTSSSSLLTGPHISKQSAFRPLLPLVYIAGKFFPPSAIHSK